MSKPDPITFNASTGLWHHTYSGKSKGWPTKREAAREYVRELVRKQPKYNPLIAGRPWKKIYEIIGINVEENS